jgi:hypothetical protein
VFVIGEDSAEWDYVTIWRKFQNRAPGSLDGIYLRCKTGFQLNDQKAVSALIRDIKAAEIKFVVVDSFRFVHGSDENSSKEMQVVMNAVRNITEETGACVMLIHHTSKPGADGYTSQYRGSSVILASCDFHLFVSAKKDEGGKSLLQTIAFAKGRSASTPGKPELQLSWGEDWAEVLPAQANRLRTVIRELLGRQGEATVRDFVALLDEGDGLKTGTIRNKVDKELQLMMEEGIVYRSTGASPFRYSLVRQHKGIAA